MQYQITIPGSLLSLNEFLNLCKIPKRGYAIGNSAKQKEQLKCESYILMDWRDLKITNKIWIYYRFFEKNQDRDKDNVAGFAHKVFQDALVSTGIIEDDGWDYIDGYADAFFVDADDPRIEITIEEIE